MNDSSIVKHIVGNDPNDFRSTAMGNVSSLTVTRLAQLKPGDLFVYSHEGGSCAGIVTIDPNNGDIGFITLGPNFPDDETGPNLQPQGNFTVLSFESRYSLDLATSADAWHFGKQVTADDFMALADGDAYIRLPYSDHFGKTSYFFVRLRTGEILNSPPGGVIGYVRAWEITTAGDANTKPQLILQWPVPAA